MGDSDCRQKAEPQLLRFLLIKGVNGKQSEPIQHHLHQECLPQGSSLPLRRSSSARTNLGTRGEERRGEDRTASKGTGSLGEKQGSSHFHLPAFLPVPFLLLLPSPETPPRGHRSWGWGGCSQAAPCPDLLRLGYQRRWRWKG